MTEHEKAQQQQQDNQNTLVKWLGASLVLVAALVFSAYYLGSSNNQEHINRLVDDINKLNGVAKIEVVVEQIQQLSSSLTLSTSERSRLTELLDQIVQQKVKLDFVTDELKDTKHKLATVTTVKQNQIDLLTRENAKLNQQVKEYQAAMSYTLGSVDSFTLTENSSFSIQQHPSSRIGLQQILSSGSVKVNVGNAVMFFHVGHTLRFRFAPNWLCNITLVATDIDSKRASFEYHCKLS